MRWIPAGWYANPDLRGLSLSALVPVRRFPFLHQIGRDRDLGLALAPSKANLRMTYSCKGRSRLSRGLQRFQGLKYSVSSA